MGKRKYCNTAEPSKNKTSPFLCILHVASLADNDNITAFSTYKGGENKKLLYLHNICDMRLCEPADSPSHMKDICDQIPLTLAGLSLNTTGYHRKCYQKFTKNLYLLQASKFSNYGKFHTAMNYIGMVTGHKCRGAGYAEILIEAGLTTSGCLKSVLSWKLNFKAIFNMKVVTEAL